jgi:hypothetical protein
MAISGVEFPNHERQVFMTCEKELARVDELQRQHKDAQDGCSSGIHGQCALAERLEVQLRQAKADLQRCLHPQAPSPPPLTTDVRLDQGDGTFLELEARVVKAIASDFMLDLPSRRKGGGPHRRALVHDQSDGLTINFNGDYPGGVTVTGNLVVTGELVLAGVALSAVIGQLQSALIDINRTDVRLSTLERTVDSLVTLAGASVIPAWQNKSEVEQGGLTAPSATELGLVIQFEFDRLVPNFNHEDVISVAPPPGSAVLRGSTVVVTLNLQG